MCVAAAPAAPVISNLFDTSITTTDVLQSPTFFVDDKPLAQKLHMQCIGTFLVYVVKKPLLLASDAAGVVAGGVVGEEEHPYKIIKLEFAFTAVDEKQA